MPVKREKRTSNPKDFRDLRNLKIDKSAHRIFHEMEDELYSIGATLEGFATNINQIQQQLLALHEGIFVVSQSYSESNNSSSLL